MKKCLALLAFLLAFSTTAAAQWQVPDHSVPIGRGPGFTGFKNAAPGASGLPLVSNGVASDPSFQQTISTANKVFHVSTAGNDANDGLSWATAKLTIQAGLNAAATGGKVLVGAGTYVSSQIDMKPSVTLECISGAIITQANSANLDQLINFFPGPGATIRNCTLDGNRANNTGMLVAGTAKRIIYVGNDNVTIDGNTIQNGPGYAVNGPTAIGLVMTRNVMTNTEAGA
jgi:polygalacturonase